MFLAADQSVVSTPTTSTIIHSVTSPMVSRLLISVSLNGYHLEIVFNHSDAKLISSQASTSVHGSSHLDTDIDLNSKPRTGRSRDIWLV